MPSFGCFDCPHCIQDFDLLGWPPRQEREDFHRLSRLRQDALDKALENAVESAVLLAKQRFYHRTISVQFLKLYQK